jgi:hypothetical protein
MKVNVFKILLASATVLAFLLGTPTPVRAQSAAVLTVYPLSGYTRGTFPWVRNVEAGFFYTRFNLWPGGVPPEIYGYTNLNGAPLRYQTLYTTENRTFTIGFVYGWSIPGNGNCGCDTIPIYYSFIQLAPPGQGFNPFQGVHDNFLNAYFCCVVGDGNGKSLLMQWDTRSGGVTMSINGMPWTSPFSSNASGLPFPVAFGTESHNNFLDSDLVGYWPNFPQAYTQFIGATAQTFMELWGSGSPVINAVDLSAERLPNQDPVDAYGVNYGIGGSFLKFGAPEDYIIWGP